MNIVLPLGPISRNGDIELKYCLLALPQHDKLYVIGRNPNLPNIIHIPFKDLLGIENCAKNIYDKLLKAFEYMDEFWAWADDYYVNNDLFDYSTYYYDKNLYYRIIPQTSEDYKRTLKNTIAFLIDHNKPLKNFNVHAPIFYRKDLFPVIDEWKPYGMAIKSIYCNMNEIAGKFYPDMKVKKFYSKDNLMQIIKNRKFFSSDDNYLNKVFISILDDLYPAPSKYE